MLKSITDSEFKALVLEAKAAPVVILYSSSKAYEPCKTMQEYVEEALKEQFNPKTRQLFSSAIGGFLYDVEKNYRYFTTSYKDITGIPFLVGFINGKIIKSTKGVMTKEGIKSFFKELIHYGEEKVEVF